VPPTPAAPKPESIAKFAAHRSASIESIVGHAPPLCRVSKSARPPSPLGPRLRIRSKREHWHRNLGDAMRPGFPLGTFRPPGLANSRGFRTENSVVVRERHHVGYSNCPWCFLGVCFPHSGWCETPHPPALVEAPGVSRA
jgi:hypothetical protein